eukprot:357886-Chlamydomonas_euryale.AAC.8
MIANHPDSGACQCCAVPGPESCAPCTRAPVAARCECKAGNGHAGWMCNAAEVVACVDGPECVACMDGL